MVSTVSRLRLSANSELKNATLLRSSAIDTGMWCAPSIRLAREWSRSPFDNARRRRHNHHPRPSNTGTTKSRGWTERSLRAMEHLKRLNIAKGGEVRAGDLARSLLRPRNVPRAAAVYAGIHRAARLVGAADAHRLVAFAGVG